MNDTRMQIVPKLCSAEIFTVEFGHTRRNIVHPSTSI